MTTERERFAAWLSVQLEERGWSGRELARRANVSHTAVQDAMVGRRPVTAKFCRKIARALQLPLEKVMRRAGLLPGFFVDDDALTFNELVAIIQELPQDERKELLEYARFRFKQWLAAKKNADDELGQLQLIAYQTNEP